MDRDLRPDLYASILWLAARELDDWLAAPHTLAGRGKAQHAATTLRGLAEAIEETMAETPPLSELEQRAIDAARAPGGIARNRLRRVP